MIHIEQIKKFGKYIGYQNFSSLKEGIDVSLNRDTSFNSRMIMEKLLWTGWPLLGTLHDPITALKE